MPVQGVGPKDARIVFIGEAPGETEEREGLPFVGAAGDVLNHLLQDNEIKREDCFIDNVMQVRPPGNNFGHFYEDSARNKPKAELTDGWVRLNKTLEDMDPQVVVALGAEPLRALTGFRGIDLYRGFPLRCVSGKLIATYHPAFVIRKWDYYPTAKMDVGRAKALLSVTDPSPVPAFDLLVRPTFGQVVKYLEDCKKADYLAFDIETARGMIDCISFSPESSHAMSIPFAQDAGSGSYWAEEQEVLVWRLVQDVLESDVKKVGQNISYEMFYLMQQRGIRIQNIALDTMIAFNLIYPGQPKSLDYLATVYTWLPFWGEAPHELGMERWKYNAQDSLVTRAITEPILKDMQEQGHLDFYYKLPHRMLQPLHAMSIRGIHVDREKRNRMRATYRKRMSRLTKGIQKIVPAEDTLAAQASIKSIKKADRGIFNPDSDSQLRNLLYNVWKFKPIYERGTKQPKVDESALRKIAELDKGGRGRFFAGLLQYNSISKVYNTYLSAELGSDGRMRCSYNIAGTVTGRLSSSSAPDGTGTNLQNQPPCMRGLYTADEGQVMLQIDKKQAENRCVAYLANEPTMIQAFKDGKDIHKMIAAMVCRKAESDVTKKDRQLGKKIGHGCLTGEHEVLTPNGWVRIDSWKGEALAVWEPGGIKFEVPWHYHKYHYCDLLTTVTGRGLSVQMTYNHKVPYYTNNVLRWTQAEDLPKYGRVPVADKLRTPHDPISTQLFCLAAAVQADGHFTGQSVQFHLKKSRKVDRLYALTAGRLTALRNNKYAIRLKDFPGLLELVDRNRKFTPRILMASTPQRITFLDELLYWDGNIRKRHGVRYSYFTKDKHNADLVQAVAHVSCQQALMRWNGKVWVVSFNRRTKSRLECTKRAVRKFVGQVYCFSVSTGAFMIRHNNRVSITGNSNYGMGVDRLREVCWEELQIKLTRVEAERLRNNYLDRFPRIRMWHMEIQAQLNSTRTLTNPLGRKRYFFERWGPDLFKEAYAHLPQSTIVDDLNSGLVRLYEEGFDLLLQVHDSVNMNVATVDKVVVERIKSLTETPVTINGHDVVIPVEVAVGPDWASLVEYKED